MTAEWQTFKVSLGEGFEQIYSVMQWIADKIRGVTIPAVNELASALSKIATEISSIVQAGSLEVEIKTQSTGTPERLQPYSWRHVERQGVRQLFPSKTRHKVYSYGRQQAKNSD